MSAAKRLFPLTQSGPGGYEAHNRVSFRGQCNSSSFYGITKGLFHFGTFMVFEPVRYNLCYPDTLLPNTQQIVLQNFCNL